MPIYEYEPVDRECLMCDGRIEVIQAIDEEPIEYCPFCGLDVRKVISKASIVTASKTDPDKAAKKGFSTFRKLEKGKWEKIAGPEGEATPDAPKDGILRSEDIEDV
ncbi:MAG: zinc ribbon domain-containing protein [Fimbriimonadaceae bacterium]|nr:zinc ribbon domain-containing protein [Fimbriimonadaceae bacterium]